VSGFVVIAGLSGAGRSTAANAFEDLGWYVIDNLPPTLIPQVAELASREGRGPDTSRVALVVGRTAQAGEGLLPAVRHLRESGVRVRVVFLDAPDDVLVRRFEDRRRRHPLSDGGPTERRQVAASIAAERELLDPVKSEADLVLDTGVLNVNQLRDRLVELFTPADALGRMTTSVVSFGFKHGLPLDADMVFDVRFLPNPHWVPELQPLTGLDPPVRDYVMGQPATTAFLDKVDDLLGVLLPAFAQEGKAYLTIAVGCTGGRHRSVVVAEELAGRIADRALDPQVHHRDVKR
jgi:UPF0042 nucleotide-binding protein